MTIDEMEQLARDCMHRGGAEYSEIEMNALARSLLSVLPVVRAAGEWRDTVDLPRLSTVGPQGITGVVVREPNERQECELLRAIDEMRRRA